MCRSCMSKKDKLRFETMRGRFTNLITGSRSSAKVRRGDAREHSITIEDLYDQYLKQNGRYAYTNIPLTMSGFFQVSLERINVKKGYVKDNILLVITPLNVGYRSGMKKEDDDREGFSGWNREKLLYAVEQNPRVLVGQRVTVQDFLTHVPDV